MSDDVVKPGLITWFERNGAPGAHTYSRRTETENGGFKVVVITEAEWRVSEFVHLTEELDRLGLLREDGGSTEEDFLDLLDVAESLRAMFDDIPGGHPFEVQ